MFPDLKTPLLWALGLGLAAALATAGMERMRGASALTDAAKARQELAEYRGTVAESGRLAERAQRAQEQIWRTRVDGVIQNGQQQIARARNDADRASDTERRVRAQLDAYHAAVRAASGASQVAGGGAATADAVGVLADVLSRSDRRAGVLAAFADAAYAAGATCERHADAIEN